jgi:hypothetical protein
MAQPTNPPDGLQPPVIRTLGVIGITGGFVKHYTFNLTCSFTMQCTFTEQQVQQDADGGDGDVEPTDAALLQLEAEMKEYLQQVYLVADKVEIFADSEDLLGDDDDFTA